MWGYNSVKFRSIILNINDGKFSADKVHNGGKIKMITNLLKVYSFQ